MFFNKPFFRKGIAMLVLLAVCLELLDHSQTAARRQGSARGVGKRGKIRGWLKMATGRKDPGLRHTFENLVQKSNASLNALRNKIPVVFNLSDEALVKKCSSLFHTPLNYKERDVVKGQSDLLQRLKAFQTIYLQLGEGSCHKHLQGEVSEDMHTVSDALRLYITKLNSTCNCQGSWKAQPAFEPSGGSNSQYSCDQNVLCRENSDSSKTQALVLSTQLHCFLHRFRFSQPFQCTRDGPVSTRPGKTKTRQSRRKEAKTKRSRKNKGRKGKRWGKGRNPSARRIRNGRWGHSKVERRQGRNITLNTFFRLPPLPSFRPSPQRAGQELD